MADKTASFTIKVNAESNSAQEADAIAALRAEINKSQDAVKALLSSYKALRGGTDEVKSAKEQLKAAVDAEKDSISRNAIALAKLGAVVSGAAKGVRAKTEEVKKANVAIKQAAPEVLTLKDRWAELKAKITDTDFALIVGGFTAIAAAIVAVTSAITGGVTALAHWVVEQANALRTMNLFREAATGSASNAMALGHQIDELGRKVPMTRKELNDLAVNLHRSLVGTRATGQMAIDTLNAVAQVQSAMGDSAARKIEEVITRGKQFGRFGLGRFELQGTGIDFRDVTAQLSKNLKITERDAMMQLMMMRVNMGAGAEALRQVIEKKFAGINARRMLDLNVMAQKFKDTLASLTEDIDLEPLLGGFKKLGELFDKNSVTGFILKKLITDFGDLLTRVFVGSIPFITKFFTQVEIEVLKFEIYLLKLGIRIKQTLGIDLSKALVDSDIAIKAVTLTFGGFFKVVEKSLAGVIGLVEALKKLRDLIQNIGTEGPGAKILGGLLEGLNKGLPDVKRASGEVGKAAIDGTQQKLEIHSPSKVYERMGEQSIEGYEKGLTKSGAAPTIQPIAPRISVPQGGGHGDISISIPIEVHIAGHTDANAVREQLTAASFRAMLTKTLLEAFRAAGIQIQTPQSQVT